MARAYTIATAALTLGVPHKWLDNTLSHYAVSGVDQKKQGVSRRISLDALLRLQLSNRLSRDVAIPLAKALEFAESIVQAGGRISTPAGIVISVDLSALRSELEAALIAAVEIAPTPHRGRPPKNKTGRLD
jgi:hypothetical protein